jgi:hypothetical protein
MRKVLVTLLALSALLTPTAATAAQQRDGDVVRYPGGGVQVWRHGGDLARLHETTAGFRRFVSHRLDVLWRRAGARPRCAHSTLVQVRVFDARKYARISNTGNFAHAGDPASCSGGGYTSIAARWNGRWREVIAGQEAFRCADLQHFSVPRTVADRYCYDDSGDLVVYRPEG